MSFKTFESIIREFKASQNELFIIFPQSQKKRARAMDTQMQTPGGEESDYSVLKMMGLGDSDIEKLKEVDESFLTKTMRETLKLSYKYLSEISSPIKTDFSKYQIPGILEKYQFLQNTDKECSYLCTYLLTAVINSLSELQYPFEYIWDFNSTFFVYPRQQNSMCIAML
jgi:hypothetical protein